MTHPANIRDIERQAAILVGKAEALGVTVRINVESVPPFVIEAWPARKGPFKSDTFNQRAAEPVPASWIDAAGEPKTEMTLIERKAVEVLNSLKAAADGGLIHLPDTVQMQIDVVLMTATQRRVGVA